MLRSVDSGVSQQVRLQSSPDGTKGPKDGGKTIASYSSPTDGGERSVVNITSQTQKLSTEEVETIRNSFKLHFGDDAAKLAFRHIDHRMSEKSTIRGEHVLTATVAAMEYVSPEIRFTREKLAAEGDLAHARTVLDDAQKEVEAAKAELAQRRGDHQFGTLAPGTAKALTEANERLAKAESGLAAAEAGFAQAEKTLTRASDRLDGLRKALDQQLMPGDDTVRLKSRKMAVEGDVALAQKKLDTAKTELAAAEKELAKGQGKYAEMLDAGIYSHDVKTRLEKARTWQETAKAGFDKAAAELGEAKEDLADIDARLTALETGPQLRRAQAMLDHLGGDPRFMEQLDKVAPGKATGGALGKLEGVINGQIFGTVLKKAVSVALPPVGVGVIFKNAIGAEDCERRLDSASRHIDDAPLAKGLATTIARGKETEKWKLGIEGTVGFVGMALTMKGASAVGTLMQPVTSLVGHAVGQGTQSLGWIVGGAVTELSTLAVGAAPSLAGTTIGGKVLESGAEGNQRGITREALTQTMKRMEVPEGTAMPVIPVRPFGPGHAERMMPLSDPDVAVAFLAYLGPAADKSLLANPKTYEMEERRLQLREEMFGAARDEDLKPGGKVDGDKELVEQLDLGAQRQSSVDVGDTSPLHLLYAGLGWTT